ncbi:MAG: hypothetical protein U9R34_02050 [Nanoarchaeota archaeon]|nr:hypothetical protein [Nanoarchaeota archaeon]
MINKMTKKGQAAMEFLMTYGWAILVVLAAIAALAYFGVLSPDRFLPNKCTLPSGMACLDFTVVDTGAVSIVMQNSLGFEMRNAQASIVVDNETCTSTNTMNMTNGAKDTFTFTGCTNIVGQEGSKLNADLKIAYTNAASGLSHVASGSLISKVTA